MLTFDGPSHTYKWDGKIVPSVTTIIAPLSVDFSHVNEEKMRIAREQGQGIHSMVELEEEKAKYICPDWLLPFRESWRKFKDESGFATDSSEKRVFHKQYVYAGTFDLAGRAPKLPKLKGRGIVDLKRSAYDDPSTGCQLAGYAAAEDTMQPDTNMRILWHAWFKLQNDLE